MVIDTGTSEARELAVVIGETTEIPTHLHFALCFRYIIVAFEPDRVRDISIEVVNGADSYGLQHFVDVLRRLWEIFKHSLDLLKYRKQNALPRYDLSPPLILEGCDGNYSGLPFYFRMQGYWFFLL